MPTAQFHIATPSDGALRLDSAVLVYRGASGTALATVHPVHRIDGASVVGAGQPLTPHKAIALARALLPKAAQGGFLSANLLYADGDLMLWWEPPHRQHVAFRVDATHAGLLGGAERGETVPHPGLVFAASSRVWRVWAVRGCQRPTPLIALHQAPYFNVNGEGAICQGSVPRPQGTTVERIAAWNDAFFRSYFTHPNVAGTLVRYAGGAYALWRDLLDGKRARFPARALVPLQTTLGALLGQGERP
ncbi:PRTRC system protein B [Pseudorhodoferax sp. Leaf267]|uniref:PRTRC system protein B n=1 Tax=Pseudorhodoferax sp. Leaf267 TaxID=1736316 RepID=UPI0006F9C468|nr:PRTRC system protein B [Pseudorhodoferax sp. Leaf267]KQP15166.1 PRTRC system protein B [Pseudorhodoferax sp. Leaf267]